MRETRNDEYQVHVSDEIQNIRPQELKIFPSGLRQKSGHTSLSSSTVVPSQPSDSVLCGLIVARNAVRLNSVSRP